MSSLPPTGATVDVRRLRIVVAFAVGVCAILAVTGIILARRFDFPAGIAVPVVAAYCWQAALYCWAVSGTARGAIARQLPAPWLAAFLVSVSAAPYVIYSVPTGKFTTGALLQLVALGACIVLPYVLFPVRGRRLTWQDVVVCSALAYPMISGLSTLFREIYLGFDAPANRLDSLGKLMLIPLGLFVFLELRHLQGTGFRLVPKRRDWKPAIESSGVGLPWMLGVGLLTGYLVWNPPWDAPLAAIASALGKLAGIYFTTALAEEFLLRGVVQNLLTGTTGRPALSQAIAALIFGATHLGRGAFPNLGNAASAAVLGWFCGRAYVKAGTVTAAMITHALAVAFQELFFA